MEELKEFPKGRARRGGGGRQEAWAPILTPHWPSVSTLPAVPVHHAGRQGTGQRLNLPHPHSPTHLDAGEAVRAGAEAEEQNSGWWHCVPSA